MRSFVWSSSSSSAAGSEKAGSAVAKYAPARLLHTLHGKIRQVELPGGRFINTLALLHDERNTNTLVLTHGYGAGLGFFFRNYAALARLAGWNVYSIDW